MITLLIRTLIPANQIAANHLLIFVGRMALLALLAMTAEASAFSPESQGILLSNYGAKCDGMHDDSLAINRWLAAAKIYRYALLIAPPGRCIFKRPLSLPPGGLSNITIRGSGPYSTIFDYRGSRRDIDLITVGDGKHAYSQIALGSFTVTADVAMNSGAAIHLRGLVRSSLSDVIVDGQDGMGNLWNGIWFDGVDNVHTSGDNYAAARNDSIRVNGVLGLGQSDLTLAGWKISPVNGQKPRNQQVGLHIGGGFGGLYCTGGTDIIGNATNVLIDTALTPRLHNREATFDGMCPMDSSSFGPNLALMETHGGNYLNFIGGWVASAKTYGIYIAPNASGWLSYSGGTVYNNGKDGIRNESRLMLQNYSGIIFKNNGTSGKGYGVTTAAPPPNININNVFDKNHQGPIKIK